MCRFYIVTLLNQPRCSKMQLYQFLPGIVSLSKRHFDCKQSAQKTYWKTSDVFGRHQTKHVLEYIRRKQHNRHTMPRAKKTAPKKEAILKRKMATPKKHFDALLEDASAGELTMINRKIMAIVDKHSAQNVPSTSA